MPDYIPIDKWVFILRQNEKHSKSHWAMFFPLLRRVFWDLVVLGGCRGWGVTSFLRTCVHCKFLFLESGLHVLVSEARGWLGVSLGCHCQAIFLSITWSHGRPRHQQVRGAFYFNRFIYFTGLVTSPSITSNQNIHVKKKFSSAASSQCKQEDQRKNEWCKLNGEGNLEKHLPLFASLYVWEIYVTGCIFINTLLQNWFSTITYLFVYKSVHRYTVE